MNNFTTVGGVTSKVVFPLWVWTLANPKAMLPMVLCEKKIPIVPNLTLRIERNPNPASPNEVIVKATYGEKGTTRIVGEFKCGELTPHVFDMIVSPAERLCLMTLSKNTDVDRIQSALKHPVWQEIVDEVVVRFLMEE